MINGFISKHPEYERYQIEDFVAFFKFRNDYKEYTVTKLLEVYEKYVKNCSAYREYEQIYNSLNNELSIVNLVNNTQLEVELDIYTPDHKYSPKHTFIMKCKETEDTATTMHVRVYSKNGLVKEYSIPAKGMSMQDLSELIDKERNEYNDNED